MGKRSETADRDLRNRLIGLGDRSFRKSYFPELQERMDQLERFRSLLDHSGDIILLARLPSTRIVDANASSCRQLGYECPDLHGMKIDQVVDLTRLQWPEEGCLDEGVVTAVMRRRDGTIFPAEVTLCVDRFIDASYLLVVGRDITERLRIEEGLKRALAAAEEARDKIDAILRSAGDGLLVADTAGNLTLLNEAAADLLCARSENVLGRPVISVMAERLDGSKGVPPLLEEGVWDLALFEGEERPRILQARSSHIRDSAGRISGVVISLQDRTRDREIDRMKTEFISTAAHEFRTPLTSIQGFSELLLSRSLSPAERREFLLYIHEKAQALGRLVGDLLDIARIESGQALRLERRLWPLREILRQVAPLMRSDSPRHRFRVRLADAGGPLPVDRDKIGQVLENLLSNAIKYSPEGTLVRIVGRREGVFYRIKVIDEGIGMTADQTARIFDKFYRADASNRAVGGIGLGMSIARSIVEAHGGEIDVCSRPGAGTTVSFTLPMDIERNVLEARA